jgi:hypothetical protein
MPTDVHPGECLICRRPPGAFPEEVLRHRKYLE